jgi:hypothetical protein
VDRQNVSFAAEKIRRKYKSVELGVELSLVNNLHLYISKDKYVALNEIADALTILSQVSAFYEPLTHGSRHSRCEFQSDKKT